MSKDDQRDWFSVEGSSNDADGLVERHLEAVPQENEWFDQASADAQPVSQAGPAREPQARRTTMLFGGVVAVALLLIGGGSWAVASVVVGPEKAEPAPLATPEVSSSSADVLGGAAAQEKCAASEEGSVVTGDGEGDVKSAAGVILAFQHAYYVERDADLVKPLLAKESEIHNLDALQKGIDSVEQGTTHCLHITSAKDGSANVELTQMAPDGSETVFYQRVTTARESGETRLVSIADAPEKER